jgi:hypothetical protein
MTPEHGGQREEDRTRAREEELDRAFEFEGPDPPPTRPAEDLRTPTSPSAPPTPPPAATPTATPGRPARRARPPAGPTSTEVLTPPPLGVLRRVSYLLGAAMAATVLFVWLNPAFGIREPRVWPWEVFFVTGEDGARAFDLSWTSDQALAVEWALATVALLVAALMPAGRARGTLAIGTAALAFAIFYVKKDEAVEDYFATATAIAPLVAGVLWLRAAPGRPGGRAVLAAGWLVAATGLLLPYPLRSELEAGGRAATHELEFAGFVREVTDPPPHLTTFRVLTNPPAVAVYSFAGAMLVGLLAFLGLGGRWAGWAAVFFLFGYVVCFPIRHWSVGVWPSADSTAEPSWEESLRLTVLHVQLRFIPFLFPLTAAILDLALARRRPTAA